MSIIFGICQTENHDVEERHLVELSEATRRYAADGCFVRTRGRIGMGFQPYYTHQRSNCELQPVVNDCGTMLTFDGRLDNHIELCQLLDLRDDETADSVIVLTAFERWGENCFSKFVGDWAIALWVQVNRSLYLARDHAGARTLYFVQKGGDIRWSTYLESFFADGSERALEVAYAARYLTCQPLGDLTPYRGIRSVTPAHYMIFRDSGMVCNPHWEWMAKDKIHLKTDAEYEQRFLSLLRQSVERRTGPGSPILAQLSGGMDSSSIVCMSDQIRMGLGAETKDFLDTVSYYDDSDPNWNEAPYFQCVERYRRKPGVHLPLPLLSDGLLPSPLPYLLPGAESATFENEQRFEIGIRPREYRVVLSGIGGDEFLGGMPTALPELADYLVAGDLRSFADRTLAWCLVDRTPFLNMGANTLKFLIHQYSRPRISQSDLPPWTTPQVDQLLRTSGAITADMKAALDIAPSCVMNGRAWWMTLETLPHLYPGQLARREYRYPYLDRDLAEFLIRVPRERLLGPGRRRAMMRSALRGILPMQIIERRRKGFRSRGVFGPLTSNPARIVEILRDSRAARMGLVVSAMLAELVANALRDPNRRWKHAVTRLILFELGDMSLHRGSAGESNSPTARRFVA
jgi:asparagine synthase (glutamine-hydrolysing)